MNKTCARCEKTVYPTEELKCLDKVWHKGCFKCQECGMTLNMRTYKGYGKLPYCEAHVPKAKHTTMAETPELKRIAENTKIQSNVKYHADFEKSKGKFTQVADDPETLRIKANTKIISNVAYHGDLEKKAQMEKQRQINENGELVGPQTPQPSRQIGRVTDLDPLAAEQPPPAHHTHSSSAHAQKAVYVAMYDYEANDSDEVSFREGDYISDVTSVDSGWMTGRVLRTGHTGMLPANYVERLPSAHGY
nr:LIM and SH3 domain protein F42H10.3 isoform X2 [Plodia interpunctella]